MRAHRSILSLIVIAALLGCEDRQELTAPGPSLAVLGPLATSVINFDDIPEGAYLPEQYADRGVVFRTNGGFPVEDASANADLFPGMSVPNVLSGHGFSPGPSAGLSCNYRVRAEFVDPIQRSPTPVSAVRVLTIGQAALNEAGTGSILTRFRLRAFDSQGNLVGSDEFETQRFPVVVEPFDSRVLHVSAPGRISFVELDADPSAGCHVHDNFEFDQGPRVDFTSHSPQPNALVEQDLDIQALLSVSGWVRALEGGTSQDERTMGFIGQTFLDFNVDPIRHSVEFEANSPIDFANVRVFVGDNKNHVFELDRTFVRSLSPLSGAVVFDKYWFDEHVTVSVTVPLQNGFVAVEVWSLDVRTRWFRETAEGTVLDVALDLVRTGFSTVVDALVALLTPTSIES